MTGILIFVIFALSVFTLGAYTIVAPWWTTRAGRAYFILFAALALLAGHFLVEQLVGQQAKWFENSVLGALAGAIAWNTYTIISKQLHYWRAGRTVPAPDETAGGPAL